MPHNPNPFDFVPFADRPILRTPEQFDALGAHYSGYLEVSLKTLTALHVVGAVTRDGGTWSSKLFTQGGVPVVPAASIRGCLRAFIEALCSGWVSKANPTYNKHYGKGNPNGRHIGFSVFEKHQNQVPGKPPGRLSPEAINPDFMPGHDSGRGIDVATYLFGHVLEAAQAGEATARRGKVWIEDAAFLSQQTDNSTYWRPDVQGKAFMGGGKPSASNWWYMQPAQVWRRDLPDRHFDVAEFVGEKFRGRKFYYHQDPEHCVKYYDPRCNMWEYGTATFAKVKVKCIKPDEASQTFRIYVNRLPKPLLHLLVLALQPGATIRHKIGYGKAYGYGSVEFSITGACLREAKRHAMPAPLQDLKIALIDPWISSRWKVVALKDAGIEPFIDRLALKWLAQILGWPAIPNQRFTYPHFNPPPGENREYGERFGKAVQDTDPMLSAAHIRLPALGVPSVIPNVESGKAFANSLWEIKTPIDFRLYQERAAGWSQIAARTP